MNDQLKNLFYEEAKELLNELETVLLQLEKDPTDSELIDRTFRALHTLKGSGGMFGFTEISMFVHKIETVYDKIRSKELSINLEIIKTTLRALDVINYMLEIPTEKHTQDIADAIQDITFKFNAYDEVVKEEPAKEIHLSKEIKTEQKTYKIIFKPNDYLLLQGHNFLSLLNELKSLGKIIVVSKLNSLPDYDEFNPELVYTYWTIILSTDVSIDTLKDVFIFVESDAILKIKKLSDNDVLTNSIIESMIYEFLLVNDDITTKDIEELNRKLNIDISESKELQEKVITQKKTDISKGIEQKVTSIRVPAEKLDNLVNIVGELVTLQARINQISSVINNSELVSISEEAERLIWDLRDIALNIRMLPIGSTFSRFKRLVFDLSKELGKEIELVLEGEETELDKTVIEKLNDPLLHLIRNSIDHGIEKPEEREQLGKPRKGLIKLSAFQVGNEVVIEIFDDGRGLNKEKIINTALEKGLITSGNDLTDNQIYQLIFLPGFSTAEKVTNLSGRGVGMDVVKTSIEQLRGSVKIDSIEGEGTKIQIILPLTLAIIDGLLVKIHNDIYVIPLANVEECIELTSKDIEKFNNKNIVSVRGEIVPYIRLNEFLGYSYQRLDIEQVVILKIGENRMGICVDYVIGEHQTVIKTLSKIYKNVDGISGATILGDGSIALILDVAKIFNIVEKEETQRNEQLSTINLIREDL